jgi:hypothetical protein
MAEMGQEKLYYRDLESFKKFFKKSSKKKVYFCTFGLEVLVYMTLGWTDHGTDYV